MQVKYKVNTHGKATLSNRVIKKVAAELDKRKSVRRLIRFTVILLIVVFIIYLIVSGNDEGKRLAENYDKLKARIDDSKHSFDRRIKLFEKNANGEIILTDTATSILNEEQKEEDDTTESSSSQKFGFTSGIDWSQIAGDDYLKKAALESAYNMLKKYNSPTEFTAGVLGNIMGEGAPGHFEGDPHAADSASWTKSNGTVVTRTINYDVAKNYDDNPGDGILQDGTLGTYWNKYRYKHIATEMNLCWNEFYRICSAATFNGKPGSKNVYHTGNPYPGVGSIGQTSGCYYEAYCEWMDSNGKADSKEQITLDELIAMDIYTLEHGVGSVSDYIDEFNSRGYTKLGGNTKAEQACDLWFDYVEQPGDNSYITRRKFANSIYELLSKGN